MASWWNKKLLGILCGSGLLMIGYLLSMTGVFSDAAKAQPTPAPNAGKSVSGVSAGHSKAAPPDSAFGLSNDAMPSSPFAAKTPVTSTAPSKGSSIEQLVEQLQSLRARRAELERQEKQVVAALKEKLKEQQERLQKLGINTQTNPPVPSVPGTGPDVGASKASFETGSLKLAEPRDGGTKK